MGNKMPTPTPKWLLIVCIVGIALVGIYIAATSPTPPTQNPPTPTGGTVLTPGPHSSVSPGPVYSNCDAAHNAGVWDIPENNDAYWSGGDGDGDGIACESSMQGAPVRQPFVDPVGKPFTDPLGKPLADPLAATAVVLKVIDGDTVDVRDDIRGRLRIRVLGIDTPETRKPGYTVGCFGPEATAFAKTNLLGQQVAVQPDHAQDRIDRYGRTLAYLVRARGWDYSVEVVRAGMALAYVYEDNPVERHPAIAAAEREAQAAGRGLWGAPCYGNIESVPR